MVFKKKSLTETISGEKKGKKGNKFGKKSKYGVLLLIVLVVLLAVGGALYMYFYKNKSVADEVLSETNLNAEQVDFLLAEVGKLMELPQGETPTIATVTDVTKLSDQDFFKKAQNGDKVIIYSSTKKAILYRPSTKKIIDVAPVDLSASADGSVLASDNPQSSGSATTDEESLSPTPAEKYKVVVLNSTQEGGLAKKGSDLLDDYVVDVLRVGNSEGEYDTTTISKVSSKSISNSQLKDIVSVFDKIEPEVKSLPADESTPAGADIVIILGNDFSKAY